MHIKKIYSNNAVFYSGNLQKCEDISFNPKQELLLNRAIQGLKIYSKTQLNKMHWEKRDRIIKVSDRAQIELELYKQKKIKNLCNSLISGLFPNNNLSKEFFEHDYKYDKFINDQLSFKKLKIKSKDVVDLLITKRILPSNFYSL